MTDVSATNIGSTDDILFTREGRIGLVTLNRPQALNALNRAMCVALHRQLMDWAIDVRSRPSWWKAQASGPFVRGAMWLACTATGRLEAPIGRAFFTTSIG